MEKYYYIGKKEALNNQSLVYGVSDTKVENYNEIYGANAIEFYGENLPHYVIINENNEVKEATEFDLYKAGIYKLKETEFINDNKIDDIYNYEINKDLISPSFNYEILAWEETATLEKQIEHYKKLVIEKTKELELLKNSGFGGGQEEINLQIEIENLKQIYMDKSHELALQIENRLKEV